jgi:hypothetical protein
VDSTRADSVEWPIIWAKSAESTVPSNRPLASGQNAAMIVPNPRWTPRKKSLFMDHVSHDNSLFSKDLRHSVSLDVELATLDAGLRGLAVDDLPAASFVERLNSRIMNASAPLLPAPAAIPFKPATRRVRLIASNWGRLSLAASILLAFTIALPFQLSHDSDATNTLAIAASFESDRPESETVLVALLQETARVEASAAPSAAMSWPAAAAENSSQMSEVSPVLSTRNASYDDFEAEMSVLLGDDALSSSL